MMGDIEQGELCMTTPEQPFEPDFSAGYPEEPQGDPEAPACMVCGRQDETLRIVALPYVISLVVVTFRRAFVGLWCWRHRNLMRIAAGAISAMFGWRGIPYGFIYTPVSLYKLAQGGDQPAEENQAMLIDLSVVVVLLLRKLNGFARFFEMCAENLASRHRAFAGCGNQ